MNGKKEICDTRQVDNPVYISKRFSGYFLISKVNADVIDKTTAIVLEGLICCETEYSIMRRIYRGSKYLKVVMKEEQKEAKSLGTSTSRRTT
jgi:hypothetical protein